MRKKAETWAVAGGASGPFTTTKFLSAEDQQRVSEADGVRDAAPVIVGRGTIGTKDLTDVNLLGTPSQGLGAPEINGVAVLTNDDVKADQARTLASGKSTIDLIQVLLWFVAAGIIALMVYLTALERVRDFAVLKATGASNGTLFGALLLQAVVLSLGAALVASVLTIVLTPMVPFAIVVSLSTYLVLAVVAVVLGAIASLAGLRRAIGVDPAIAFGGA